MENVVAKFICSSVTKSGHWNGEGFLYGAEFNAVTSGSDENKKFFEATPNGSIKLWTVVEDLFEPGKEYYIHFQKADE